MRVSLAYFFYILLNIYLFIFDFQPIMAILGKKKRPREFGAAIVLEVRN